ncbi:Gfo/Idh/MocA family oxidoreductase [Phaeodactylibacter sp.]|uniref:Gfo/Idh/MocA family protein n=1 Tax=Phaeodactylibacter sp. TaxID=1940289 RepID=UPI0025DB6697|nr:Gfo/Idh/MocA family oxidoreductase [Phaeodactylibacter sp.]MCI4648218.1 Gfo/Idh/MocA family oxidoreductase [Phaeodactylibacter sp.]MCI5091927.1 Gfo/Idh/MocA family oxidoreductase [Phaeodactylibacter sp.]
MSRKIRMGMVGGGRGAFIGAVHRMAATLDGEIELVCGAFSSDPEKSKASGADLYLPPERVYGSFEEMILKEKALPEGERMDFVSIVTPNHVHFPPAKMALEHGFSVVCDKPLSFNTDEALELQQLVESTGLLFSLTHNYTGYPMVKQARAMVRNGEFGAIRKVIVAYPQGWLSTRLEATNQKQASWRTDPKRSGAAGAMGDIGTHAENLAEYITGLRITKLCADLHTFVEGRQLDDDGSVLLRFDNGARGILYATQVAAGEENALHIRVYGEKGGLEWHQMYPNDLKVRWLDKPEQLLRTGVGDLYPDAQSAARIPAGHPEGYLEAFANIYRNFANCLRAKLSGQKADPVYEDFPTVADGVRGMKFIDRVIESSESDQKWLPV